MEGKFKSTQHWFREGEEAEMSVSKKPRVKLCACHSQ